MGARTYTSSRPAWASDRSDVDERTPPSTSRRPSMTAGSYQPGMEQDATTASASGTQRAPAGRTSPGARYRSPRRRSRSGRRPRTQVTSRPARGLPGGGPPGYPGPRPWRAGPRAVPGHGAARAGPDAGMDGARGAQRGEHQPGRARPQVRARRMRALVQVAQARVADAGTGSPRCRAVTSSRVTPQRRAAASTLPALVPTIRSTSPTGTGRRCWTACRAPVIQAAPTTPPDPSTSPVRGREPYRAASPRRSPILRHSAPDSPRGAHVISPAGRSPGCPGRRVTAR